MPTLSELIMTAITVFSTTYSYGEMMCGDIGKPVKCQKGAITASGIPIDGKLPIIAIAAPTRMILRPHWVHMQLEGKESCHWLLLADKMNPRYIGKRGFDLTPSALRTLGVTPDPTWSGNLIMCKFSKVNIKKYEVEE